MVLMTGFYFRYNLRPNRVTDPIGGGSTVAPENFGGGNDVNIVNGTYSASKK